MWAGTYRKLATEQETTVVLASSIEAEWGRTGRVVATRRRKCQRDSFGPTSLMIFNPCQWQGRDRARSCVRIDHAQSDKTLFLRVRRTITGKWQTGLGGKEVGQILAKNTGKSNIGRYSPPLLARGPIGDMETGHLIWILFIWRFI